ncbi:hypothetical protein [Streptomyces sp. Ru73]|uniref:hypothetical protein n=1 Tax=Streptomyces sp. Ru73 TaxID=2080748 RepID=UPI0011B078EB|nr:hypothetical protein [Streptomyces sp. Ru73]
MPWPPGDVAAGPVAATGAPSPGRRVGADGGVTAGRALADDGALGSPAAPGGADDATAPGAASRFFATGLPSPTPRLGRPDVPAARGVSAVRGVPAAGVPDAAFPDAEGRSPVEADAGAGVASRCWEADRDADVWGDADR